MEKYEILVVDNASEDDTCTLVSQYSSRINPPKIRYIRENRLGSSWARNAGWQHSIGNYVVYIDDDEYADENWLSSLLKAFEKTTPTPAVVAGSIFLDWEGKRPDWLPVILESYYSLIDFGPRSRFLTGEEYPLTANLAVRRDIFHKMRGFRTDLGHVGTRPSGGEDIDFIRQIHSCGELIYYEPEAKVFHFVPKARQTRRWLLWRSYAGGLSQPILNGHNSLSIRRMLYNARMTIEFGLRALFFSLIQQDRVALEAALNSTLHLGRIIGQIRSLRGTI